MKKLSRTTTVTVLCPNCDGYTDLDLTVESETDADGWTSVYTYQQDNYAHQCEDWA